MNSHWGKNISFLKSKVLESEGEEDIDEIAKKPNKRKGKKKEDKVDNTEKDKEKEKKRKNRALFKNIDPIIKHGKLIARDPVVQGRFLARVLHPKEPQF